VPFFGRSSILSYTALLYISVVIGLAGFVLIYYQLYSSNSLLICPILLMKWVVQTISTCYLSKDAGFIHRLVSVGFVVDNVTLGDVTLRMFGSSPVSTIALLSISNVTTIMASIQTINLFIYLLHS
jgi:hypothetical protein